MERKTVSPVQNVCENQRGNALILILPVLIVVAAAVELVFNQTSSFTSTVRGYRTVSARNSIVSNFNTYANMPATFRSSVNPQLGASVNPALQNCLFGTGPGSCLAGTTANPVKNPVTLYAPVEIGANNTLNLQVIAGPMDGNGPAGQPALYDIQGNLCSNTVTSANTQCPFEVYASFTPTCAGNAPACAVATAITLNFMVTTPSSPRLLPVTLSTITQQGSAVTVASIMPQTAGIAQYDISLQGQINVLGTAPTMGTTVTTGPSMAAIEAAVAAGGVTNQTDIVNIAQAFVNASLWNVLPYITAVTQAGYVYGANVLVDVIIDLGIDNITNQGQAVLLAQVGVADPNWMNFVLASGVTNLGLDNNTFGMLPVGTTPQQYANAANAAIAAGLPTGVPMQANPITEALVAMGYTNSNQDLQIYNSLSGISDPWVAGGIILGSETASSQIPAIVNAAAGTGAGIASLSAGALAQLGITDPNLAQTLANIVTIVPNPYAAAQIIVEGGGNVPYTQLLADEWTPSTIPPAPNLSLPVYTTTTPGSPGSPAVQTPPVPTATASVGTISNANPGQVSACLSCSILTF